MEMELAAGTLVILCIIIYISYSFSHKKQMNLLSAAYQNFRQKYQEEYYVAMGTTPGNLLEKDCGVILAADRDGIIRDAMVVESSVSGGGTKARQADEYLGMDLNKYFLQKSREKEDPMRRFDRKTSDSTGKEKAFAAAGKNILEQVKDSLDK